MEAAGFVERAKGKVVAMGVVSCVANAVGSVVAEFPAGGTDGGDLEAQALEVEVEEVLLRDLILQVEVVEVVFWFYFGGVWVVCSAVRVGSCGCFARA